MSKEEFYASLMSDIDPQRYAGEGFTALEEIARPDDIGNAFVRGEAKRIGDYWPGPDKRRSR